MSNKYKYTEKCREISGFGGDYESTCRQMVIKGMEWCEKHQDKNPMFSQNENIIGIIIPEDASAKSLEEAMTKDYLDFGLTGAMVHYTINHVLAARKMGWDNYIQEMEKKS